MKFCLTITARSHGENTANNSFQLHRQQGSPSFRFQLEPQQPNPCNRMQRAIEKHYSVSETAFLLGYSPAWVRQTFCEIKSPYCRDVVKDGKDFRIPASAINAWRDAHLLRQLAPGDMGIAARSETELKRKLAAQKFNQ